MPPQRLRPTVAILLLALFGLFLLTNGIESWTLHSNASTAEALNYVGQALLGVGVLLSTFFVAEIVVRDREAQLDRDRIRSAGGEGQRHLA